MPLFRRFRERRAIKAGARKFVGQIMSDPGADDIAWLTAFTKGDADHAVWELRYLRFAIGLIAAQHQSLEDRLPAIVSHELLATFARDRRIASANLGVAQGQFNARLRAYSAAYNARVLAESWDQRVARTLLEFAGAVPPGEEMVGKAAQIVRSYYADASDGLNVSFGITTLPEHIAPSEAFGIR